MGNNEQLASEIRLKVIKLLERLKLLENQAENFNSERTDMLQTLAEQKNTINNLQEQNKILKLAGTLKVSDEDKQALRKKLAAYIQEIDECIRLLSER